MLSAEQLARRKLGLTASDLVTLFDPPPFAKRRTEYDVWLDKTMDVEPREPTGAMEVGNALEPAVIAMAARKLNVPVVYPSRTFQHPEFPLFMATPDAHIVRSDGSGGHVFDGDPCLDYEHLEREGLIEAKVVGVGAMPHWREFDEDEGRARAVPPTYVYTQAVAQMWVRRLPFVWIAALLGTEFVLHKFEWDAGAQDLAEALREEGTKWWMDHVASGRPPEVDGSEGARRMLAKIFPRSNGTMLQADAEAEDAARKYFTGKKLIEQGKEMQDDARAKLMSKTGEVDGIKGDGWRWLWKTQAAYDVPGYHVEAMRKPDMRAVKR